MNVCEACRGLRSSEIAAMWADIKAKGQDETKRELRIAARGKFRDHRFPEFLAVLRQRGMK
ncbi:MAG: hypothetical protein ABSG65_33870 [Bryobacteraceae bacterium]